MAQRENTDGLLSTENVNNNEEAIEVTPAVRESVLIKHLDLPPVYKNFFQNVIDYTQDPNGYFGDTIQFEHLIEQLNAFNKSQIIGISDAVDLSESMKAKGAKWDGVVESFIQGCAGQMSPWVKAYQSKLPIALRSIAKKKIMQTCESQQRDYYYIDTGYFGNGKLKTYHRITKNAMQWLGSIEDRPADRLDRTGIRISKMSRGSKILICPPSQKAMDYWGLNVEDWLTETTGVIEQYSDREIVVRKKVSRTERQHHTIEQALADDIHCMVTFNSIAAVESLICGKPVFTMGPNAAHHLSNHDLTQIESPYYPTKDEVHALLRCLSYHQFTQPEMRNGYAWAVLNGEA